MKVASIPTIFIIILLALGEAVAQQHVLKLAVQNCNCYPEPDDFMPKMLSRGICVFSYCDTSSARCNEPEPLTLMPGSPQLVGLRKKVTIPLYWCDTAFWRDFWEAVGPAVGGQDPNR